MRDRAYITGSVLIWARETAKYSVAEVADKLKCPESKILDWENEINYPTISQAEKLSRIYRRPLAAFFLPSPPEEFHTLRDFRSSNSQSEFSTALTFAIREIQHKQEWIREFLLADAEHKLGFVGRFSPDSSIEAVAADIINELNIKREVPGKDLLKHWVEQAESKRIFISLSGMVHSNLKISVDEARGFVASDAIAPFIFINSKDSKAAQLFTLVHELAHLWLGAPGVSNVESIDFRDIGRDNYDPVEVMCNKIAAEALMPAEQISELFVGRGAACPEIKMVDLLSKRFGVSPLAISIRLLNLDLINRSEFLSLKGILEDKYKGSLENEAANEKKGHPYYYLILLRKNGRAFTHYVYDYYKSGKITGLEASSILNMKLNKFSNIEKLLFV